MTTVTTVAVWFVGVTAPALAYMAVQHPEVFNRMQKAVAIAALALLLGITLVSLGAKLAHSALMELIPVEKLNDAKALMQPFEEMGLWAFGLNFAALAYVTALQWIAGMIIENKREQARQNRKQGE
jgi:hypothetical protein